ncbi:MAG: ISL3 family transposase [Chloroflexota bacterium]|nr:ISL3 family transposase [Chloroflexota bacterium]
MLLSAVFPQLRGFRLEQIRTDDDDLTVVATSTQRTALCSVCSSLSSDVHSRYQRRITDLPCAGHAVTLLVHARRFFCRNPRCPRKTFRECLPILAAPRARSSHGVRVTLARIGFALGGAPGARLARLLGMTTSGTTVLRLVRATPGTAVGHPRILGIDDWAWRKGARYGTIICDLEQHRPVDLLPDRSADTVAAWLRTHPGVAVISRDRGDIYIDGATRGAPDAVQVADRFHLIKNLGEAVEGFLHHKQSVLKHIGTNGSAPVPVSPPLQPWQVRAEEESERRHAQCLARYEAVMALRAKGVSIADIARNVEINRETVVRYLRLGAPPERKRRSIRGTVLDPYKEYLLHRWDEGCHDARRLCAEIRARGYRHAYTNVSRFLAQLRLPVGERPSISRERISAQRPPTPRQVAMLFVRRPETLTEKQQTCVEELCRADAAIATAYTLAQAFTTMVHERQGEEIDAWIARVTAAEIADLQRFAVGLLLDKAAVQAGLTLEWSNGQTEGQVNRLKSVKRQMYGRAGFDLLRQRVLHGT